MTIFTFKDFLLLFIQKLILLYKEDEIFKQVVHFYKNLLPFYVTFFKLAITFLEINFHYRTDNLAKNFELSLKLSNYMGLNIKGSMHVRLHYNSHYFLRLPTQIILKDSLSSHFRLHPFKQQRKLNCNRCQQFSTLITSDSSDL